MNEQIDNLRYLYLKPLLSFKKFRTEDSIIIFSEARAGSTWMMDILNHLPGTVANWEPLSPYRGVVPKKLDWGNRPYIPEDDSDDEKKILMKEILSMERHSPWTLSFARVWDILTGKKVITKFVRANMLLPWIKNNIPLKYKPIVLIRHPVDSVLSAKRAFGTKRINKDKLIKKHIENGFTEKELNFLQGLDSDLELKTADWCLNNKLILNDINLMKQCIAVHYEDLLINPKSETKRVFRQLNVTSEPEKIVRRIRFRKSTATDHKNGFKKDPKRQLFKNIKRLDKGTKDNIQRIFDHLNFKMYNAYSPLPDEEQKEKYIIKT